MTKQKPASNTSDHYQSGATKPTNSAESKAAERAREALTNDKHQQELLDEAIEESFPASDSPTVSHVD